MSALFHYEHPPKKDAGAGGALTPELIYLQWYGNVDPEFMAESEKQAMRPDAASWWCEQIHPYDIEYIRKDLFDAMESQLLSRIETAITEKVDIGIRLNDELAAVKKQHAELLSAAKEAIRIGELYQLEKFIDKAGAV